MTSKKNTLPKVVEQNEKQIISLNEIMHPEILESKIFSNEKNFNFLSPRQFFEPLICGETSIFLASDEVKNINEDMSENISYKKIMLRNEWKVDDDLTYSINISYSLGIGKPIYKLFSGFNVRVCSNGVIFRADQIKTYFLDFLRDSEKLNHEKLIEDFNNLNKMKSENMERDMETIEKLKSIYLPYSSVKNLNGVLLHETIKNKLLHGSQCILSGIQLIEDKSSKFYIDDTKEISLWNYYNCLTTQINKMELLNDRNGIVKSIVNETPDKNLSLFNLFNKILTCL